MIAATTIGRACRALLAWAVLAPLAPSPAAAAWLDAAGNPLPFQSDEEVLEFLATAEIVESEFIGVGVTRPKKVVLRAGGVTAHASFRYHHDEDRNVRLGDGRRERFFLDSYRNELPAYRVARHLGLPHVPPTVLRAVDGRRGSLQMWIEGAMSETERIADGVSVPEAASPRVNRQKWDMFVFDNLVRNIDRNTGNYLWDEEWRMWWIDCTRCFARSGDLPKPESLHKVSRALWDAIRALDEASLVEATGDALYKTQVRALLARRDLIVERLEELIEERGEAAVLFERD